MSEDEDKESKTEEPSRKKLEDAVKKGQVVNSREVTSFVVFLLLTITFIWIIPYSLINIIKPLRFCIENAGSITVTFESLSLIVKKIITTTFLYLSPVLFITMISAVISSYFQHGKFIFAVDSLKPKLSRISPIKGFKRIVSLKSLVEFLKGIFKISLVGIFVLLVIFADIKELSQYQSLSISGILDQLFNIIKDIIILITIIMSAVAAIDYSYQNYEYIKNLKMSKQEVKEEHKQTEGNPEIKQRFRKLRRDQSKKQIKTTVPKATVVITNPTHYAVALKYDPDSPLAPICVAKGLDLIAKDIKLIAKESNISIIESPELARALYKDVDYNQEIPVEHFEEVAKIISYVMSLKQQKTKQPI